MRCLLAWCHEHIALGDTCLSFEIDQPFQSDHATFEEFVNTQRSPEIIAEGCIWTEGPVWLNQRLYFNDIPNKRMLSWSSLKGTAIELANSEFSNGNTVGLDGRMVSCEHGGRRVIARTQPDNLQTVDVIADRFEGKRLNSPNDVVVKSDGSIWFTDPSYGIDSNVEGYAAPSEIGRNNVYRVGTDGHVACVSSEFVKPNGLAFSPDEKQLYIADSGAVRGADFPEPDYSLPHHVRAFDVENEKLTNGRTLFEIDFGVPDGLRVDSEGFIWCSAGDGIRCYSPAGEQLGKILLPKFTANCCFGGETGTDLFITSSDKVYRVETTRRCATSMRP